MGVDKRNEVRESAGYYEPIVPSEVRLSALDGMDRHDRGGFCTPQVESGDADFSRILERWAAEDAVR